MSEHGPVGKQPAPSAIPSEMRPLPTALSFAYNGQSYPDHSPPQDERTTMSADPTKTPPTIHPGAAEPPPPAHPERASIAAQLEGNSLYEWYKCKREQFTPRTLYVWVGAAALVVAGVWLLSYYRNKARVADAMENVELESANEETLKKLREEKRGTRVGREAALRLARLYLGKQGLDKMRTNVEAEQKKGAEKVEEARNILVELAPELKDEPASWQEAWFLAGKAEEALIGFPKGDKAGEFRGEADKAISYYEKAASVLPDSAPAKAAGEYAKAFKEDKDARVAFYKDLYGPKKK